MRHRKTYMYVNFQQNRVNRSVKIVHTNLFAKKMQLEFRKITRFGHALPITDIQANFGINRPIRYQVTTKRH